MNDGIGQASPDPEWLEVGGVRLGVRRFGPPPGRGPTIIFLHEGLGSAGMWRDYPRRLCELLGWSGLAYSRRGYGISDAAVLPRPISFMHDEALALSALLDAVDLEDAVLYGHSDGASIALLFAARRPRRARALVLEAPHVFIEDITIDSIARIAREYSARGLARKLGRWHADPDATFGGWTRAWLDPAFRSWDIRSVLPAVRAPCLVMQGRQDEYGTWAQVEAVEAGVAGTVRSVRLEACGHTPHRDRPGACLAEAVRFLQATSPG